MDIETLIRMIDAYLPDLRRKRRPRQCNIRLPRACRVLTVSDGTWTPPPHVSVGGP